MAKLKALPKGFGNVPIERLVKAHWNYKDEDSDKAQELMDKLENNFKRNGQIENILIRELDTGFYEVVNGNHRYDVCKRLNMDEIMAFNLGKISLADAKRVAIETNESKFEADQVKLAQTIGELVQEFDVDEMLDTLPFDHRQVENFQKLIDFDWDGFDSEDENKSSDSTPGTGADPKDFKALRYELPTAVAEMFENQIDRFKKLIYPDEQPKNVSYIMPIEAMIQALNQIPDKNILGDTNNGN